MVRSRVGLIGGLWPVCDQDVEKALPDPGGVIHTDIVIHLKADAERSVYNRPTSRRIKLGFEKGHTICGDLVCIGVILSISSRNRSESYQDALSEQHITPAACGYPNVDERTRLSFTHSLVENVVFPHRGLGVRPDHEQDQALRRTL